ncbi:MAG: hypothetical protein ACXVJV_13170, partial [Mucilaginibacter sp.]
MGNRCGNLKRAVRFIRYPFAEQGIVVTASSDNYIYGIAEKDGKLVWKVQAGKAVLGHPLIEKGIV